MQLSIQPLPISQLSQRDALSLPSSKSHTLRALLFALMGEGTTTIFSPLRSKDTDAMLLAIQEVGAQVTWRENALEIQGVGGLLQPSANVIDAGNSGLVLRLFGALAALLPTYTVITGDASIRERRVVAPLVKGLQQMGAFATTTRLGNHAPIVVRGPLLGGKVHIDGCDSQPISALLIASSFAKGPTTIHVDEPGEIPWIDLTLSWLDRLHLPYEKWGYHFYSVPGGASYQGFSYEVPADLTSLSYPLAAALVTQSPITLTNLDFTDMQGDKKLFTILRSMGARLEISSCQKTITLQPSMHFVGSSIDVNPIIDTLPLLAVLGCYAKGETTLYNGAIARKKESDRISTITRELKKMGAVIAEKEDGICVKHSSLQGAFLESHEDHRIAMALTIASLFAKTPSTITGVECVLKSYPSFFHHLQQLGASLQLL